MPVLALLEDDAAVTVIREAEAMEDAVECLDGWFGAAVVEGDMRRILLSRGASGVLK